MFSCCRANPKKSKHIIEDVSDNKKVKEIENVTTTTSNDNKKLIIPTITIENGKTIDETNTTTTTTNNTTTSEKLINGVNKIPNNESILVASTENITKETSEEESLAETETVTVTATVIAETTTNLKEDSEPSANGITTADTNGIIFLFFLKISNIL